MDREVSADLTRRARRHAALGDAHRLAVVDALALSDRTPSDLQQVTGLSSNLLAFHLDVLEDAGLVHRTRSQGDARRRYVRLAVPHPDGLLADTHLRADTVVFVCTANAARSPLAAALWQARTGRRPLSAGVAPVGRVHPRAVEVAARHGLDLAGARPRHVDDLDVDPDLVVSVCDRAGETGLATATPTLHWSVPDPVGGPVDAFERAYQQLADRVERLAAATTT